MEPYSRNYPNLFTDGLVPPACYDDRRGLMSKIRFTFDQTWVVDSVTKTREISQDIQIYFMGSSYPFGDVTKTMTNELDGFFEPADL